MKLNWMPGPPQEAGIFWFRIGFNREPFLFVLQCHLYEGKIHTHLFGDSGSGPLDCYYRNSMFDQVQHARIPITENWVEIKEGRKFTRAWVRHPKGYTGFGLLHEGWNGSVGGTIVWMDKPQSVSESGAWMRAHEGYKFSRVEIP